MCKTTLNCCETLAIPIRMESPEEIAALLHQKWSNRLDGGALIANPIPEDAEIAYQAIQGATEWAIKQAEQEGIQGKELTPYLLAKIEERTQGASLKANIQLVLNNALINKKV